MQSRNDELEEELNKAQRELALVKIKKAKRPALGPAAPTVDLYALGIAARKYTVFCQPWLPTDAFFWQLQTAASPDLLDELIDTPRRVP